MQDADVVPVGKDQYSHMELMRELADSVNEKYGKDKKILVRAETMNRDEPINILSLNGEGKMSKSKPEGAIFLTDSPEVITKKIPVAGLPYAVGESLPIIYNPQNSRKILLDAGKKSFTGMLVFTLLIAAFIIFACFMIQKGIANGEM